MYFFGFKLDGPIAVGGRGLISGGGGGAYNRNVTVL